MSKCKFLNLEDCIKVIQLSESGKASRLIAEEMGVGRTQIQTIMKRKREKSWMNMKGMLIVNLKGLSDQVRMMKLMFGLV